MAPGVSSLRKAEGRVKAWLSDRLMSLGALLCGWAYELCPEHWNAPPYDDEGPKLESVYDGGFAAGYGEAMERFCGDER